METMRLNVFGNCESIRSIPTYWTFTEFSCKNKMKCYLFLPRGVDSGYGSNLLKSWVVTTYFYSLNLLNWIWMCCYQSRVRRILVSFLSSRFHISLQLCSFQRHNLQSLLKRNIRHIKRQKGEAQSGHAMRQKNNHNCYLFMVWSVINIFKN